MKFKLAIFDMDGTILNTLDDMTDSCNYILQKYNYPTHELNEIKFMVGNGIPKLIERALPQGTDKETFDKVLADFIEYYGKHCADKTRPYDGIIDCIKTLKKNGIKIAVNTNKVESAAIDLCNDYFPELFDVISGSRPGMPPKPDPAGIYEILQRAGIDGKDACFIGDSDVDVACGLNAKLDVIGVDWGFRGEDFLHQHGADTVVKTPSELADLILSK